MKAMLAVLLFASLFYLAPAKEVSINSTVVESANCTTSFDCWFFDPVFWVNQIIPSDNDEVVIVDITAGSALFINSSISLAVLDIESNFHIYITASANVSITNLTLSSFAHLHVQDQAQVYGVGITNIVNGSELSVSGTAFAQAGSFFLLDNSSSIWGFSGYTGLHADYNIIQGTLSFSNTAMFASTGGVIEFVDKSFTFEISPLLYNAVFRNSQITFKAGYRSSRSANLTASVVYIQNMAAVSLNNFFVDELSSLAVVSVPSCTFVNQNILGSLVVTSSNIVVANLTSFGPVVIHGAVTINATNSAHFNIISFATGANGEAANLTVNTNYLHVRGVQAIDFPQVVFNVQDFAYFRGAVHVEGGINVAGMMLVEDSGMHVIGDINVGFNAVEAGGLVLDETQLIVDTLRIAHSGFLSLNFSEISGNVSLHQNSTLTHHESKFNGNVYNNGYIEVHSALAIGGNYTQGPNGILLSYLELANTSTRTSGYLQISGNAAIEGAIKYSVLSKPKSESNIKLVIVQTLTGVTGKFHADPEDVSDSGHKASVLYSANDVYLTFGKKASNPASIWWVWFIVAAAIIAIVGLIVLLVKTHRRRQYSAVEM